MKNNTFKITFVDREVEKEAEEINEEYFRKTTTNLNKSIGQISYKITKFNYDDSDYLKNFENIENEYKDINDNVNDLMEIVDTLEKPLKDKIFKLNSSIRKVQSSYMDLKVGVLSKKVESLEDKFNKEIETKIEETQEITNNTFFNIASVFLGVSLVSSMVAGIQFLDKDHFLLYYLTIGWVALMVLSLSSILIRRFNLKSFGLILVLGLYSLVVLIFGWKTFDVIKDKNKNDCNIKQEEVINK